jgi:hypothetical protein
MAYEDFYAALRDDTGRTATTLPDADAEATFVAAQDEWGDAGTQAGARVLIIRVDWASASNAADYTQNEESERLSQIANAKKALLDYWQGLLDEAIAAVEIPVGQRPALFGLARASNRRWYP